MTRLITFTLLFFIASAGYAQKGKVITANTLFNEGNIPGALENIEQAFSHPDVPNMAKAWILRAEIYSDVYKFQMGEDFGIMDPLSIADQAFRKTYELDMSSEKKSGKYVERVTTGMFNTAIGFFEVAAAQFNAQQFDISMVTFEKSAEAIRFLRDNNLIEENNENAFNIQRDSYQNAALCALNIPDYEKAKGYYELMVATGTATENVYANLASIMISQKEFDAAIQVIDKGRELYPDNESIRESELNYYIGTDQSDKAVDKILQAIERDTDNPDLYFNLALAYDKLGNKEDMVRTYETIIEMDPGYHSAYLNLGAYYNEKANEVIKTMNDMTDWKEAIKLEPDRNMWYNKALPNLEKAYQLDTSDENVKNALERIYANLNMLDKIEELRGQ